MKHDKQKKDDSQDQFQQVQEEVETITSRKMDSPPKNNIKNHPRLHYLAQKHKLGLMPILPQVEPIIQSHNKKQGMIPIGKIIKMGSATFRSNFQSGSLGSVNLIGNNSFKITLDPQTNSSRGNTWFDFIVEGLKGEASFTIAGFRKRKSLYSQGMKVCYRQLGENSKWKRGGTQICYAKENLSDEDGGKKFEVKFSFFFKPTDNSGVEFAYCFPYGLTKLHQIMAFIHSKAKLQTIASSFEGIDLSLANIGNLSSKEVIVLSARVHPGETVSSFIMEGFLKQIVSESESARFLREKFLFKLMPMINVDGVRHGNFRFCASGVDLNRRWKDPSQQHQPEIYYLKQMILRENKQKRVRMFIDMHGHSRKKNVFFYGCCQQNHNVQDNFHPKAFPFLMSKIHEPYSYQDCSFNIQLDKQGTARIALWNQLKINQIYTLEASFCSSEKGSNYHISDYEKMGHKLCQGIAIYFYQNSAKYPQLAKAVNFRQKVYNELKNDTNLLKQGNEENSGSQSEPQKGEHLDHQKEKNHLSSLHDSHDSAKSKQSHQTVQLTARHNTNQQYIHLQVQHQEEISLKHKSEAAMHDDNIEIEPEHIKQLFTPQLKAQSAKTVLELATSPLQKHTIDINKHIRVHHPIKGNSVPIAKLSLYADQELLNEEDQQKKDKRLVTAFENTQYRRIKHMVEQKFCEKMSHQLPHNLAQSINSKKIEVQSPHQGVVARFYANTPSKTRKSSVEAFYNKPSKSMGKPHKEPPNVICRGRQIMF